MNIIIDKGKESTKLPKVMRASIHLFVKQGVDGTTIKDIAQRAGAAEGTMYRYYESKEVLAWQLFVENLSDFVHK